MSGGYLNKNNFGSMPILNINVSNPYIKMPRVSFSQGRWEQIFQRIQNMVYISELILCQMKYMPPTFIINNNRVADKTRINK